MNTGEIVFMLYDNLHVSATRVAIFREVIRMNGHLNICIIF